MYLKLTVEDIRNLVFPTVSKGSTFLDVCGYARDTLKRASDKSVSLRQIIVNTNRIEDCLC